METEVALIAGMAASLLLALTFLVFSQFRRYDGSPFSRQLVFMIMMSLTVMLMAILLSKGELVGGLLRTLLK